MKKKNLTNYEKWIIYIIAIATFLFIVFISLFLVPEETHILIYKTECLNETHYNKFVCPGRLIHVTVSDDSSIEGIIINNKICLREEYQKENCKEKEVEEITWRESCGFTILENGTEIPDCRIRGGAFMPKSKITISWLNENCICQSIKVCTEWNIFCENKCSEYKCFEKYRVEVWNQIK